MLILSGFIEAAFSEGSHTIMIVCLVFVVGWFVCLFSELV